MECDAEARDRLTKPGHSGTGGRDANIERQGTISGLLHQLARIAVICSVGGEGRWRGKTSLDDLVDEWTSTGEKYEET